MIISCCLNFLPSGILWPTMLCQNHMNMIKGFMGQTTAYNRKLIKSNVLIMGENKAAGEVRYIHGEYGKGTWSFWADMIPKIINTL